MNQYGPLKLSETFQIMKDVVDKWEIVPANLKLDKHWKAKLLSSYVPLVDVQKYQISDTSPTSINHEPKSDIEFSSDDKASIGSLRDTVQHALADSDPGFSAVKIEAEPNYDFELAEDTQYSQVVKEENIKSDDESVVIKCHQCETSVNQNDLLDLLKHIRLRHGADAVVEFRLLKTTFLPFQCDDCEYCFANELVYHNHKSELYGKNKKYSKCRRYAKLVKRYRKQSRKASQKKRKDEALPFETLVNSSFRCPLQRCNEYFTKLTDVVSHVEKLHTTKEFIVFMTGIEFFENHGKRCTICDFIYLKSEMHSGAICMKYRGLKQTNKLTNIDFHQILNQMVDLEAGISFGKNGDGKDKPSDTISSTESEPRRRKKRKRPQRSVSDTIRNSDGFDDSDDSDRNEFPDNCKKYRLANTVYYRCPVKNCRHKTLRAEDGNDITDMNHHLRISHGAKYRMFNMTKFPFTGTKCPKCNFWLAGDVGSKHGCHPVTKPIQNDSLCQNFDLDILIEDFMYEYEGTKLPYEVPDLSQLPDNENVHRDKFWSDCPFEGCRGMDRRADGTEWTKPYIKRQSMFRMHFQSAHGDAEFIFRSCSFENEEEAAPFRCRKCNWFFFSKTSLYSHRHDDECVYNLEILNNLRKGGLLSDIRYKSFFLLKEKQEIDDILQFQNADISNIADLQCPGCMALFKNIDALDLHVKSDHGCRIWTLHRLRKSASRPVVCSYCSFCYADDDKHQHHLDTKNCEFNQSHVEFAYSQLKQPSPLWEFFHNSVTKEPKAFVTAAISTVPSKFQEKIGPNQYPCPNCDKVYSEIGTVYGHLKRTHGTESWLTFRLQVIPGMQEHVCTKCRFVFEKFGAKHDCQSNLDYQKSLTSTTAVEDLLWPCPICNKSFSFSFGSLYSHILLMHGREEWVNFRVKVVPKLQEQKCNRCLIYFHQLVSHACKDYNSFRNSVTDQSAYPCPKCNVSFQVNNQALYQHLRYKHSVNDMYEFRIRKIDGIQPYKCPTCPLYGYKENFHKYKAASCQRAISELEKYLGLKEPIKIQCSVCHYFYPNKGSFTRHFYKYHEKYEQLLIRSKKVVGVFEEKCPNCEFYFTSRVGHRCHENIELWKTRPKPIEESVATISGEPVLGFECPVCGKKQSTRKSFQGHIYKCHNEYDKLVIKSTFIRGVQEHKCARCKLYFYELSTHKNCHIYEEQKLKNGFDCESSSCLSDDDLPNKSIKCEMCEKEYTDGEMLHKHIKLIHGINSWLKIKTTFQRKIYEYKCQRCKFYFVNQERATPSNHSCNENRQMIKDCKNRKTKLSSEMISSGDESETAKLVKYTGSSKQVEVQCPECRELLPNIINLYSHLKSNHGGEKWLQFRTKKVKNVQEYQCPNCFFYFGQQSLHNCERYKSIIFSTHDEQSIKAAKHSLCFYCPNNLGTHDVSYDYSTLVKHIQAKHPDCYNTFRTTESLIQPFKCSKCLFFFNSSSMLSKHQKNNTACAINLELNNKDDQMIAIMPNNLPTSSEYYAQTENKTCNIRPGVSHMAEDESICPVCAATFQTFIDMDTHFRSTHDRNTYTTFRREDNPDYKQSCVECDFKFPTEEEYFLHFEFCNNYAVDLIQSRDRRSRSSAMTQRERRAVATGSSGSNIHFTENPDQATVLLGAEQNEIEVTDLSDSQESVTEDDPLPVPMEEVLEEEPESDDIPILKTEDLSYDTESSPLPELIQINGSQDVSHEDSDRSGDEFSNQLSNEVADEVSNAVGNPLEEAVSDDVDVYNSPLASPNVLEDEASESNSVETEFEPIVLSVEADRAASNGECTSSSSSSEESHDSDTEARTTDTELKKIENNVIEQLVEINGNNTKFNAVLHKKTLDNDVFGCIMMECNYVNNFQLMIRHLREVHGDAYLIYRYRMLEVYGIMKKKCDECKYQFLSKNSYTHHKEQKRCPTYQQIKMPSGEIQASIVKQMRPHLSPKTN